MKTLNSQEKGSRLSPKLGRSAVLPAYVKRSVVTNQFRRQPASPIQCNFSTYDDIAARSSTTSSSTMDSGSESLPLEEDQDLETVTRHRDRTWPLLALMLLVNLAASLYQLPLNRVVERRLCYEYYSVHDPRRVKPGGQVDESLCKIDDVQQRLGWILGVMETAWVVGGKSRAYELLSMLTYARADRSFSCAKILS